VSNAQLKKSRHQKAKKRTLDAGQGADKRKPKDSHRHHSLTHFRSLKGR